MKPGGMMIRIVILFAASIDPSRISEEFGLNGFTLIPRVSSQTVGSGIGR